MLATPELILEKKLSTRLASELSRCREEIPLYRPALPGHRRELRDWPFITKKDIRQDFPRNFLGAEVDLDELVEQDVVELEHTSGTSEERTPLLLPRGWWAEQEKRALALNAVVGKILRTSSNAKRATINSPVCSGDIRFNGVPSKDDRILGNSLFVSLSRYPFLWSERDMERIAREILDWNPEFLDVDPVYGVVFALYCQRHQIRLPALRFIICSYEYVSVVHRSILSRVFNVPVLDLYGSTETGHLLMEDDTNRMRPSLETAFLEVVNTDEAGIGALVVTTLTNPFMPLVRYRIGDLVERLESPYGARYLLHGREVDAFTSVPSRRVTTRQIDQCFLDLQGVAHYQLIQNADRSFLLKFVPAGPGPGSEQLQDLTLKMAELLESPSPVVIQRTDMLVPESSGKFRLGYPDRSASRARTGI